MQQEQTGMGQEMGITKEGQSSTLVVPPRLLMTLVSNYTDDATPYDSIVISPDQKFVAGRPAPN